MRAVAQRVTRAEVEVDGEIVGAIGRGLLVYLGAAKGDVDADLDYVAQKLAHLRVFEDDAGKMSRSVVDVAGGVLVVPQFTLFGDVRRGRRPSFDDAAPPDEGRLRYEAVVARLRALAIPTETGRFRAHMSVRSDVDGPITILIDSRKLF
jgi:D-tyrosyl-tRNA(Tyr) deacylase